MTNIEQSYGSRLYPRLTLLAVGMFVVATNAAVIAGLLPSIASTLGVGASDVSYSITYYSIVVAVAAPIISIAIPRWSRTALMTSGMLLITIGTVIAAAASTNTIFTVGRVLAAFGGAALVPAATAAAVALAPAAQRGRAIAFVAVGFTAANALGSPVGTALGAFGGWRLPLFCVAGLALLLSIAYPFFLRHIPVGEPVSLAGRFAPLRDGRILMVLAATLFVTAGFNVVYVFSSSITRLATGGSGVLLAVLLFLYGFGGIFGNIGAGRLTDHLGNRRTANIFMISHALALFALPLVASAYVPSAIVFALWGLATFAAVPALQHRLIDINPATSSMSLSWYTTAMYVGLGIAPPLGALATSIGGPEMIPLFGAGSVVVAFIAFQLGFTFRRDAAGPVTAPILRPETP